MVREAVSRSIRSPVWERRGGKEGGREGRRGKSKGREGRKGGRGEEGRAKEGRGGKEGIMAIFMW